MFILLKLPSDLICKLSLKVRHTGIFRTFCHLKEEFFGNTERELQARILKYIEHKTKIGQTQVATTIKNTKPAKKRIRRIDQILCDNLYQMSCTEKLDNVHNLIKYVPRDVVRMQFYGKFIPTIDWKTIPFQDQIRFIYYLSIQKAKISVQKELHNFIAHINFDNVKKLNIEDFCIICLSAYKTSTPIYNTALLHKIDEFVSDHKDVLEDRHILTTIVKTMRHNKYYNEHLLKHITNNMYLDAIKNYTFKVNVHFLALLASALYYDRVAITSIVNQCLRVLKKDVKEDIQEIDQIRIKDVARFIWAVGFLGTTPEMLLPKDEIVKLALQEIQNHEITSLKTKPIVVDILLSLLMIDFNASKHLKKLLTDDIITSVKGMDKYRYNSRLNLLLICLDIEKTYKNNYQNYKLHKLVAKHECRQTVLDIYSYLLQLPLKKNIKFTIGYQIPNLKIEGITISEHCTRHLLEIEVLDGTNCLNNTDSTVVHGIMKLKLKLLQTIGAPVLKVDCSKTMLKIEQYNFLCENLKQYLDDNSDETVGQ